LHSTPAVKKSPEVMSTTSPTVVKNHKIITMRDKRLPQSVTIIDLDKWC
jgi:hypothetical protein